MEIASIFGLAAATLGVSLLIAAFVGTRGGGTRQQTTRPAQGWGKAPPRHRSPIRLPYPPRIARTNVRSVGGWP